MIKQGRLRGEKVQYDDGIGCTIWEPIPGEDEDFGLCWDYSMADSDDLLELIKTLKEMPAEKVVHVEPDPVVPEKRGITNYVRKLLRGIGWRLISI